MKKLMLLASLVMLSYPAEAAEYAVDYQASHIVAKGEHAGNGFEAKFQDWSAEIYFDASDLANSHLKATFNPAELITGNKMYDGTLLQVDWFNVKKFPKAHFTSESISLVEGNVFKADGVLTIRDIELPLRFDFTLDNLDNPPVSAVASFPIDRLAYDLGKGSDPEAEWVSQNIMIDLKISANPKP